MYVQSNSIVDFLEIAKKYRNSKQEFNVAKSISDSIRFFLNENLPFFSQNDLQYVYNFINTRGSMDWVQGSTILSESNSKYYNDLKNLDDFITHSNEDNSFSKKIMLLLKLKFQSFWLDITKIFQL